MILKAAQSSALRVPALDYSLVCAFSTKPRSSAAVETIALLLEYSNATAGMPPPDLSRLFMPDFIPQPQHLARGLLSYRPPKGPHSFREEGVVEITLEITRMVHERLEASTRGVDGKVLRVALVAACQPGGLKVCEWLSSLGAFHCVDHVDLVKMLARTALPADVGGNDIELAEWLLAQADIMGLKGQVVKACDVPRMISMSGDCTIARLLISHGAGFDSLRARGVRKRPFVSIQCDWYTRDRNQRYQSYHAPTSCVADNHVLFRVCSWPDMEGADEMLRLALDAADAADGDVGRLVNCALSNRDFNDVRGRFFTLASLICRTNGTEPEEGAPTSESARLAMLKILLDAGAEVHAMVECSWQHAEILEPDENGELPRESLWNALFWEGERQLEPSQEVELEASAELAQEPREAVIRWNDNAMQCAIQASMPTLVHTMLEARPLPNRNHPSALLYIWAACGGRTEPVPCDRLSPQVVEVVLNMANLEHADLPLNQAGCTALMALMRFYQESDYDPTAEGYPGYPLPHDCRCEPELLNFENDPLSNMVSLLLARGAKWNTPPLRGGLSALGELRALLSDEKPAWCLSKYKQHNVTEFRKHIVLDIYSESAVSAPDFNPFEMGAIKATRGGC